MFITVLSNLVLCNWIIFFSRLYMYNHLSICDLKNTHSWEYFSYISWVHSSVSYLQMQHFSDWKLHELAFSESLGWNVTLFVTTQNHFCQNKCPEHKLSDCWQSICSLWIIHFNPISISFSTLYIKYHCISLMVFSHLVPFSISWSQVKPQDLFKHNKWSQTHKHHTSKLNSNHHYRWSQCSYFVFIVLSILFVPN